MIIFDENGNLTPAFLEYERELNAHISILVESVFTFLAVRNQGTQADYEHIKEVIKLKVAVELNAQEFVPNDNPHPAA